MKLLKVFIAVVALLFPMTTLAATINVYPGPDEDWNYLYDFGDVEVGASGVMIFQIETDELSPLDLTVENVFLETEGPFGITDVEFSECSAASGFPFPCTLANGDSMYVEVTFTPTGEGYYGNIMHILSDASNIPPGSHIYYGLQGMGIGYEPPPDELMQAVMDFYDAGLADGSIYGLGNGNAPAAHLRVFHNMLDAADDLIAAGDFEGACQQLEHVALKSDGLNAPPDFIGGPGVSPLNAIIIDVMAALGC